MQVHCDQGLQCVHSDIGYGFQHPGTSENDFRSAFFEDHVIILVILQLPYHSELNCMPININRPRTPKFSINLILGCHLNLLLLRKYQDRIFIQQFVITFSSGSKQIWHSRRYYTTMIYDIFLIGADQWKWIAQRENLLYEHLQHPYIRHAISLHQRRMYPVADLFFFNTIHHPQILFDTRLTALSVD